jgi:hypothetical protein
MNHRRKTGVDEEEEKMRPATAATEIVLELCSFFFLINFFCRSIRPMTLHQTFSPLLCFATTHRLLHRLSITWFLPLTRDSHVARTT